MEERLTHSESQLVCGPRHTTPVTAPLNTMVFKLGDTSMDGVMEAMSQ